MNDYCNKMEKYSIITVYKRVKHVFFFPEGAALPLTFASAATSTNQRPKIHKVAPKRLPEKPQRRSEESCRSGNSYVREKFQPGPRRMFAKLTHACVLLLPGAGEEEYILTLDFMIL